jgi:hypothetical protein
VTNPHHAAAAAITALRYNGANLDVAQHWLSGWRHGHPPRMSASTLEALWQYKPAVMICRVVKDKSLTCIKAGALLRVALGFDASNRDLLALLPQDSRAFELERAWAITEGAITVRYRRFSSKDGHEGLSQGIALPFSGEDADGGRYFLMHTNWRPVGNDWVMGNVDVELGNTSRREMISFMDEPADLPHVVNL